MHHSACPDKQYNRTLTTSAHKLSTPENGCLSKQKKLYDRVSKQGRGGGREGMEVRWGRGRPLFLFTV